MADPPSNRSTDESKGKEQVLRLRKRDKKMRLATLQRQQKNAARVAETSNFWDHLETVKNRTVNFENVIFNVIKTNIVEVKGYILKWNVFLVLSDERNCSHTDCDRENEFPLYTLEMFEGYAKGGINDGRVQVTYDPIYGIVYVFWDRSLVLKINSAQSNLISKLKETLEKFEFVESPLLEDDL